MLPVACAAGGAESQREWAPRPQASQVVAVSRPGVTDDDALAPLDGAVVDPLPDGGVVASASDATVPVPAGLPRGTVLGSGEPCKKDSDCEIATTGRGCCACRTTPHARSTARLRAEKARCNPKMCARLGPCFESISPTVMRGDEHLEQPNSYSARCIDRECAALKVHGPSDAGER